MKFTLNDKFSSRLKSATVHNVLRISNATSQNIALYVVKIFGGDEVWRFRLKIHKVLRISNATAQILHLMWWNFSVEVEFGSSGCWNFCCNIFKWGEGWRFIMFCAFPMQLLKILHFMWWNFSVEIRFGGSGWRFIMFCAFSMLLLKYCTLCGETFQWRWSLEVQVVVLTFVVTLSSGVCWN